MDVPGIVSAGVQHGHLLSGLDVTPPPFVEHGLASLRLAVQ